ncbi:MAG: hypothetical protein NTU44_13445 [Bacteroidetes bacterium]|nr:hypothetical protein [Bacteroidota bacterium]
MPSAAHSPDCMYGDTPAIIEVLTSRWFFSLNGGIPPWMHVDFFSAYDNFFQYLNETQRYFLSWHWFPKLADLYSPERLYLIVPAIAYDSQCFIDAVLYRKGHAEMFKYEITQNLCAGETYEIDASFRNLFPGIREEVIDGYEVSFRSASFSTAVFRFDFDNRWLPNVRYFLFLNSLGAFECVRFTGETIHELAFTREYYEQSALSEYRSNLVPKSQIPPDTKRQFKTNTGWISLQEVIWMQDFLNSTNVFEIKGGKQYPVLITLDKIETHRDNVYLYAMTISFEYVDFPNVYQIERATPWQDVAQVMDPYQQS